MRNGCILCGGVGTGKSRTGLAYYFIQNGGLIFPKFKKMQNPQDLYIITTARKRDTQEWETDMTPFLLSTCTDVNAYPNKVVVDSWNNIKKYQDIKNAFFIFDEQRVVSNGVWTKSFITITQYNKWILLSATPGDTWMDYIPIFIANGFYRNRSEFVREHVVMNYRGPFPKVDRYLNTGKLVRLRNSILIDMHYERKTESHYEVLVADYAVEKYKYILQDRWNPWTNSPIENASELCYCLRKIVNSDPSRLEIVFDIFEKHKRVIVFYNFDYELDLLRNLFSRVNVSNFELAEWNGHKHQPLPCTDEWAYLVQYNAGAEGWNCIKTDTIIFYSQNYSYKMLTQAAGRIDRLNTPYSDLYYYRLRCRAPIDVAISRALTSKKQFNESRFVSNLK